MSVYLKALKIDYNEYTRYPTYVVCQRQTTEDRIELCLTKSDLVST